MVRRSIIAFFSMIAVLLPGQAVTHPHVWILSETEMVFEDGKIVAVRVDWKFDQFFSLILFEDFDWDQSNSFSSNEIDAMREGAFSGLEEIDYFTHVKAADVNQAWGTPHDFDVGVHEDGEVVSYAFTLPLVAPIDPATQTVSVSLYDPDFYVAIDHVPNTGFRVSGRPADECRFEIEKDLSVSLYFDSFNPDKATLDCGAGSES